MSRELITWSDGEQTGQQQTAECFRLASDLEKSREEKLTWNYSLLRKISRKTPFTNFPLYILIVTDAVLEIT